MAAKEKAPEETFRGLTINETGRSKSVPMSQAKNGPQQADITRKRSGAKNAASKGKGVSVAAMRAADRWLVWEYVEFPGKRPRKTPLRKQWNKPENLLSYKEACAEQAAAPGRHLGFALGDGWHGIDVDGAFDTNGEMLPHAKEVWDACKGAYCERSPSGTGYKVFLYDSEPPSGAVIDVQNHVGRELYTRGRYFAVTGDVLEGCGKDVENSKACKGWRSIYAKLRGAAADRLTAATYGSDDAAILSALRLHTSERERQLRDALSILADRASDRETWVAWGHAIKAMGWDDEIAFAVWHDWASQAQWGYEGEDDCRHHWEGFKPQGKISVGTIFREAQIAAQAIESVASGSDGARYEPILEPKTMDASTEYVLKPFLIASDLVYFFGDGGMLKSTLIATLSALVSQGKTVLDLPQSRYCRQGGILWVSSKEEDTAQIYRRHVEQGGSLDNLEVSRANTVDKKTAQRVEFDAPRDLPALLRQTNSLFAARGGLPAKVVVLDTADALIAFPEGGENSTSAVKHALGRLSDIAREFEVAIVMLGHENKKAELDGRYRHSGSPAWVNESAMAYRLTKHPADQERWIGECLKRNGGRPFVFSFGRRTVFVLESPDEVPEEEADALSGAVDIRMEACVPRTNTLLPLDAGRPDTLPQRAAACVLAKLERGALGVYRQAVQKKLEAILSGPQWASTEALLREHRVVRKGSDTTGVYYGLDTTPALAASVL